MVDQNLSGRSRASMRARSIAFIGLSIALIAVCSWVTVPIGPVPFTMQMFAIPLVMCVLAPRDAIAAVYGYVALGAIGIPVFSGMRGGIGVLLGPTGGFLIGYLIGVPVAVGILYLVRKRSAFGAFASGCADDVESKSSSADLSRTVRAEANGGFDRYKRTSVRAILSSGALGIVAGLIFTFVSYACGCIQYMAVGGVGIEAALATSVIPFIIPDVVKVVLAVVCAQSVLAAVGEPRKVRECSI